MVPGPLNFLHLMFSHMKLHTSNILYTLFLYILLSACSSSDPEPELTAEEKQIQKLAKTWSLGTVHYGDDDVSNRFENFSLTFTKDNKYTANGSLGDYDYEPFKASGTWSFYNNDLNAIGRNDGVVMATVVTDNTLKLTFAMTEANGRRAGLGGYQFNLVAQ